MKINRKEGRSFGKISHLYDSARVSYPTRLINDIIFYSGVKANGKVLDVGCGTGQATIPFAERDFNVVGLDISQEMVDVAKNKCSLFKKVSFRVGTFEDVKFPFESFDTIISGMAWHWITLKDRYKKAFKILKKKGTLALFWSYQQNEKSEFVKEVSKVLDKYNGLNRGLAYSRIKNIIDFTYTELRRNKFFNFVEIREYEESIEFSKQRYLDLISSYGWVQMLSKKEKQSLTGELRELCSKYKEPLMIPFKYVIMLARKAKDL